MIFKIVRSNINVLVSYFLSQHLNYLEILYTIVNNFDDIKLSCENMSRDGHSACNILLN